MDELVSDYMSDSTALKCRSEFSETRGFVLHGLESGRWSVSLSVLTQTRYALSGQSGRKRPEAVLGAYDLIIFKLSLNVRCTGASPARRPPRH